MTSKDKPQPQSWFLSEMQMAEGRTTDVLEARSSCEAVAALLRCQAASVNRVIRVRKAKVNRATKEGLS